MCGFFTSSSRATRRPCFQTHVPKCQNGSLVVAIATFDAQGRLSCLKSKGRMRPMPSSGSVSLRGIVSTRCVQGWLGNPFFCLWESSADNRLAMQYQHAVTSRAATATITQRVLSIRLLGRNWMVFCINWPAVSSRSLLGQVKTIEP
jgi:hypothetical protein